MNRVLNLEPSIRDERDLKLRSVKSSTVQWAVDLRKTGRGLAPVLDQGLLGSCVGHGTTAGCFAAMEQTKQFQASRLFVYYAARAYGGNIGLDVGATIVDGLKAVNKLGCPKEDLWPYDISKFTERPPRAAYRAAVKAQAVKYSRVEQTWDGVRNAIGRGLPIVVGLMVYPHFEAAKSGVIEAPSSGATSMGGHCATLVGYEGDYAILRNSWSTAWGNGGDALIHRDYLLNPEHTFDLWQVETIAARVKMFDFLSVISDWSGFPLDKLLDIIPDILDVLSDLGDGDLRLTVKNRLVLQEKLDSLLGGLPNA